MLAKGNFRKIFGSVMILAVFSFMFLAPVVSRAEEDALGKANENLSSAFGEAKGELTAKSDIWVIIGNFLQIGLGVLGVILLCLIIYGGYTWLMANGNQEEVDRAVKILKNSIWGLIVVLAAFTITTLVVTKLTEKIITPYNTIK